MAHVYVVRTDKGYTEYPTPVAGATKQLRAMVDLVVETHINQTGPASRGEDKLVKRFKWAYGPWQQGSGKATLLDVDRAAMERGLDKVGERLDPRNQVRVTYYAHPSRQTPEHKRFIAGQRKAAMLQQPPKALNDGAFTGPLKRDPAKVRKNADAWSTTATWTENLVEQKPVYYCRFVPKNDDERTCEVPANSSLEARAISAVWLRCEPDDPALHVSQIVRR